MITPVCTCEAAKSKHSFASVRDAVLGTEMDGVLATCDETARSEEKWMSLYRCRVCGTVWAQACFDSGHVLFFYLYPAPQAEDPVGWLHNEAQELLR